MLAKIKRTLPLLVLGLALVGLPWQSQMVAAQSIPSSCEGRFLTLPVWYSGLQSAQAGKCEPVVNDTADVIQIVLNIIEAIMQIVAYVASFYILLGGVRYMTSLGEPDKVAAAKSTIRNAVIGLIIAIFSVAIVAFVGGIV